MNFPDRINSCFVIVTYNPDFNFTINLLRHLEIVDKIIIIDNNSNTDIETFIPNEFLSNIIIIHSNINYGIAWGLNKGLKQALELSYEWVVTFDQDSFPNINILLYYTEVLKNEKNVGLIGTSFAPEIVKLNKISWSKKLTIITSGTLHPTDFFDKVGFYTEKLFIDCVDFDFSLRVKMAGYDVIRINEPLLKHKLGSPIKKFGLTSSNHNLIRRYYYGKNNVYLSKIYFKKFPLWIIKKNYFFIKSIIILILVERDVYNKIISVLKGIKDGFKDN